ncbi:hypothetical protein H0H93_009628 [Arthromyces matolae]|nr:hypothetical protein H0H93_009628 [Arthromyces matolae]
MDRDCEMLTLDATAGKAADQEEIKAPIDISATVETKSTPINVMPEVVLGPAIEIIDSKSPVEKVANQVQANPAQMVSTGVQVAPAMEGANAGSNNVSATIVAVTADTVSASMAPTVSATMITATVAANTVSPTGAGTTVAADMVSGTVTATGAVNANTISAAGNTPNTGPVTLDLVPFKTLRQDLEVETPLCCLVQAFPSHATRLHAIETMRVETSALVNLATVNPSILRKGQYLRHHKSLASFSCFFLVGMVTFTNVANDFESHSISIAFSDRTFPRAMAVIGNVTQKDILVVPAYRDGVSLGSYKTASSRGASSPSVKSKLAPVSPSKKASKHNGPVRSFGERFAIYDGRMPFAIEKYQNLQLLDPEDLEPESAVIAVFTVGSYINGGGETVVSFNIQDVILVADVDNSAAAASVSASVPLWVRIDEPEGEQDNSMEEESDDEGVLV